VKERIRFFLSTTLPAIISLSEKAKKVFVTINAEGSIDKISQDILSFTS
jgi:adenylate kinase family enzyme